MNNEMTKKEHTNPFVKELVQEPVIQTDKEFFPFNPFLVKPIVQEPEELQVQISNYQKVLEFNKAFGVTTNTKPQLDIFDKDPKLVEYRLALIEEEVQEFKDAIGTKDFTETIDALVDSLYVILGACASFGFDADQAFDLVHKSNMSKLCETEEDAIITVKKYKEEVPQRYDSPAYRQSDNGIHFVVYNQSTMKILKNYKYSPVDFTSLLFK